MENRSPRDIDVVTFFVMPTGETQESLDQKHGQYFDHDYLKTTYKIDSYFIELGQPLDGQQVKTITYWYSMWSHRRDNLWKGFVEIDLNPARDTDVRIMLDSNNGERHE